MVKGINLEDFKFEDLKDILGALTEFEVNVDEKKVTGSGYTAEIINRYPQYLMLFHLCVVFLQRSTLRLTIAACRDAFGCRDSRGRRCNVGHFIFDGGFANI